MVLWPGEEGVVRHHRFTLRGIVQCHRTRLRVRMQAPVLSFWILKHPDHLLAKALVT